MAPMAVRSIRARVRRTVRWTCPAPCWTRAAASVRTTTARITASVATTASTLPTDSQGSAGSPQPGAAADLGAQGDQRKHGMPDDPAERVSGADSPNAGGIAGSPGGPASAPPRIPGEDRDSDAMTSGSQSGNDPQRDQQI